MSEAKIHPLPAWFVPLEPGCGLFKTFEVCVAPHATAAVVSRMVSQELLHSAPRHSVEMVGRCERGNHWRFTKQEESK